MKNNWIIIAVIVIVALGGWYWYSSRQAQNAQAPSTTLGLNGSNGQTNTGQVTVPPVITVANDPKLGSYLVSADGMTLYTFDKDTDGVSNCVDVCATTWPSYAIQTAEPLRAGDGVTGNLASLQRTDGVTQLTYNGKPVYNYANDVKPGDTTGDGYKNLWHIVKP